VKSPKPHLSFPLCQVSANQIASLHHPLHEARQDAAAASCALHLLATRPGTLKLTLTLHLAHPHATNLTDTLELLVFAAAHFAASPPANKHARTLPLQAPSPSISHMLERSSILLEAGSQFQVRTNMDRSVLAHNIHYQLAFFDALATPGAKFCDNGTVQVSGDVSLLLMFQIRDVCLVFFFSIRPFIGFV
jgi:hypothetical protein